MVIIAAQDKWVSQGDRDKSYEWIGSLSGIEDLKSDFKPLPGDLENWKDETYEDLYDNNECETVPWPKNKKLDADDNEI
jgi:hypothetical protein